MQALLQRLFEIKEEANKEFLTAPFYDERLWGILIGIQRCITIVENVIDSDT
jgi:hypothetical protein